MKWWMHSETSSSRGLCTTSQLVIVISTLYRNHVWHEKTTSHTDAKNLGCHQTLPCSYVYACNRFTKKMDDYFVQQTSTCVYVYLSFSLDCLWTAVLFSLPERKCLDNLFELCLLPQNTSIFHVLSPNLSSLQSIYSLLPLWELNMYVFIPKWVEILHEFTIQTYFECIFQGLHLSQEWDNAR